MKSLLPNRLSLLLLLSLIASVTASAGNITYPVSFNDPAGAYSSYYSQITTSIQAAGARWTQVLAGSGTLEVLVEFDSNIATLDGASYTSAFVHKNGARDVFEQGAAYEIRTGTDPNGTTADIHIRINPTYLQNQMWFDPDPSRRTAPIPADHQDAFSLFLHELGHAFIFSGFRDGQTGALPVTYESTFDEQVQYDGSNFYFIGANAEAVYGGPVPITYNNYAHLGNNSPRPGADLLNDLMNGISYTYQMRYDISALDLAIAKDIGVVLVPTSQLLNIATRLQVGTGDNALIGGFIPTGNVAKKVVIRGIGPSLTTYGITNALPDPVLELHGPDGTTIATNDNWKDDANQASQIQAAGLAPKNDLESALVATLDPGKGYTAIVSGKNGGTGVGLAEVYDIDPAAASKLGNIATRGFVDKGDNVMIGGLIVGPAGGSSTKVVVRGIGPSLTAAGVNGALQDPTLELHDSNGATIASNDNWQTDANASQVEGANLAPKDPRESAIYVVLPPAAYTAIVRGKSDTTGVGLVEVYNLP